MIAYGPHDPRTIVALFAALAATLLAGLAISRLGSRPLARAAAWALILVATIGGERLTADEPPGLRMLAIVALLFTAMKSAVTVDGMPPGTRLPPARWLAFAAMWPGMRPTIFATAGGPPRPGATELLARGAERLVEGVVLCAAARWAWNATGSLPLATVLLLPGLSLMLHFGVFNLAAGAWRALGVDAEPLFRAPLAATSLTEFWGRRWNLAFSEMTSLAIYRPVSDALGRGVGILAAFLTSGLLHEVAISLPVRQGFGMPLAYFALHGALVLFEKRTGRPRRAKRLWTWLWVVGPLPILFHRPFLAGVVWPLLGASRGW